MAARVLRVLLLVVMGFLAFTAIAGGLGLLSGLAVCLLGLGVTRRGRNTLDRAA